MLPGLGSVVYILTGSKSMLPGGEAVEDKEKRDRHFQQINDRLDDRFVDKLKNSRDYWY